MVGKEATLLVLLGVLETPIMNQVWRKKYPTLGIGGSQGMMIEVYLRLDMPEFDGSMKPEKFLEWIKEWREYLITRTMTIQRGLR